MIDVPQDPQEAMQVYLALSRFERMPETRPLVDWLTAELTRLDAANRNEPVDVAFRQRQGACQVIGKLLKLAEEADNKAEKIRANLVSKGVK